MFKETFLLTIVCCIFIAIDDCRGNESPGFFLKISKNVPRIGRRAAKTYGEFFMKQAKNVPRIGRRSEELIDAAFQEEYKPSTIYEYFTRPTRKLDMSKTKFYSHIRPIDSKQLFSQISNDLNNGSDLKFISWQDFDKALESDMSLFSKLHSLGRTKEVEDLLNFLNDGAPSNANAGYNKIHFISDEDNANSLFYRTDRSFDNNFLKISSAKPGQGLSDDQEKLLENK